MKSILWVSVLGVSVGSSATITLPQRASSSGVSTVFRESGRVYQSYVDESQLSSVLGPIEITGVSFRLSPGASWGGGGGVAWPPADLRFNEWSFVMGEASAGVAADGEYSTVAGGTFATRMDGEQVVRSGQLTLAAGSYAANGGTAAGAVHDFGPVITFTTAYLYHPGETLVYAIIHSGFTADAAVPAAFFDSTTYANGVADAISTSSAGTLDSTPEGFSSPYILQFEYRLVPEPGSVALLTGGLVLYFRRRR